jgi:large subunit ribosomal protein L23
MSNAYDILIRPVLTEKTTAMMEAGDKVVFRVKRDATKSQIKDAVQRLFGLTVKSVNTIMMPSKPKRAGRWTGRRSGFKKAVVTLHDGEALDLFALEGAEAEGEV